MCVQRGYALQRAPFMYTYYIKQRCIVFNVLFSCINTLLSVACFFLVLYLFCIFASSRNTLSVSLSLLWYCSLPVSTTRSLFLSSPLRFFWRIGLQDHDTILFVSDKGVAYGIRAFQVPVGSRVAKGVPVPQAS